MNKLIIGAIILLFAGCKEKFISPVPPINTGFLVVEGVVNNGEGQTNIKLSRTTSLNDNTVKKETGATVKLESTSNTSFFLTETNEGNYSIENLRLDTSLRYRLAIKTSNTEEYLTDYVTVRNNPPIDSINWARESGGVKLYINTHDPKNNTRYYQWEYNETWEFHSAFFASLKFKTGPAPDYKNVGVVYRDAGDPQIYICWKDNASTSLIVGSSAKLSSDIIHLPINFIGNADQKISVLYSILVTQYAWSKEGYEFLERMKKNTESVGSIFDAQPSELNGNIHCISNPNQPTIGFFNICTIQKKRIFIKNSELPDWVYTTTCQQEIIENDPDSITVKATGMLPINPEKTYIFSIITFNAAPEYCVDCTLTGTNVKPIFWP